MQFQVPQNIDLEDKIIGPVTFKNFIILLFGGMFVYLIFLTPMPRAISIIIAIPITLALLAITFVKIQDQSFIKFFTSLMFFWFRPKQRIWSQKQPKPEVIIKNKTQKEKYHPTKQVISSQAIEKLATIVDTKGWKPITSNNNSMQESTNVEERVKSTEKTNLPQKQIEDKNIDDILEVPKISKENNANTKN